MCTPLFGLSVSVIGYLANSLPYVFLSGRENTPSSAVQEACGQTISLLWPGDGTQWQWAANAHSWSWSCSISSMSVKHWSIQCLSESYLSWHLWHWNHGVDCHQDLLLPVAGSKCPLHNYPVPFSEVGRLRYIPLSSAVFPDLGQESHTNPSCFLSINLLMINLHFVKNWIS